MPSFRYGLPLLLAALALPASAQHEVVQLRTMQLAQPSFTDYDGRLAPFARFDGRVVFSAFANGESSLWTTDGTPEGTVRLPFVEGASPAFPSAPLDVFEDDLYFAGNDAALTPRLWRLAPGDNIPEQVSDAEYRAGTFARGETGRFYFTGCTEAEGCEPYASNGQVTDILSDILPGGPSSNAGGYRTWEGSTYFIATNESGRELWVTDGTDGSTFISLDFEPGAASGQITDLYAADQLYLLGTGEDPLTGETAGGLWSVAGGATGTASLLDESGIGGFIVGEINGVPIIASRSDVVNPDGEFVGTEPFAYRDGAFQLLGDLNPGTRSSLNFRYPRYTFDGELFFMAEVREGFSDRRRIFRTDGTFAFPVLIPSSADLDQDGLALQTAAGLYLTVHPDDGPTELWLLPSASAVPERVVTFPEGVEVTGGWGTFDDGLLVSATQNFEESLWAVRLGGLSAADGPGDGPTLALTAAPSPTAGTTTFTIEVPAASSARLAVYDLLGRLVATLHEGPTDGTSRAVRWDAETEAPGLYIARLETPDGMVSRRVVVTR